MSDETNVLLQSLTPLDLKQLSRQQKVELVKQYRASGARNANVILFLATDLLAGGSSGMSDGELYEVYEQVLIASLECGNNDNAGVYLNLLEKRFGRKSIRVQQLRGLCLEAEGKVAEAKRLYELIKKEQPTNDFVVKRLVAIAKSEGRLAEAVRLLEEDLVYVDEEGDQRTFLEVHGVNAKAVYHELSHLHYLLQNNRRAIYYAEEAMLREVDSYYAHTRLGELHFMEGNLSQSAIEFAQSLRLNQQANNARAAYGLWLAADEMLKNHNAGVKRLDEDTTHAQTVDLRAYAADTLRGMYAGSPVLSALDAFLLREA